MSAPLRILQLVGSPTNDGYRDLSELYARGCVDALTDPSRYQFVIAHISPDGRWRFPESLAADALADAPSFSFARAVKRIADLRIDAAVPQLFCARGMIELRALLDLLELPYLGNRPLQMALALDKAKAKAIVASTGVDVPASQLLRAGELPDIAVPAVVKPNDADNSDGVALVTAEPEFAAALDAAFVHSREVLVETYVELGREVRCGIVERRGRLICLPLEEYFVDLRTRPIRRNVDKLARTADGDLTLVAKTERESWIVAGDDPIVPAVWEAARRCYTALGSRQYNLFDFRIDPHGRPWFLESGPYCSYSPKSVIVTMVGATGISLERFFAESLAELFS